MSRRITTRALVAHHLRSRAGGGVVVAALVLVLAVLATAAPIALGLLGDAALRSRLQAVPPTERDVVSTAVGLPQFPSGPAATTDEMWGGFLEKIDDIRSSADEPLPEILGSAMAISRTAEDPLAEAPRTRELSVAFAPQYDSRIRIVDGRLPEPSADLPDAGTPADGVAHVEIVLSSPSAVEMEWPVGETRSIATGTTPTEVTLTGVFEPIDPSDDYWQHVPSVIEPNIFDDGNGPRRVTATGFAHPASLPPRISSPARRRPTSGIPSTRR